MWLQSDLGRSVRIPFAWSVPYRQFTNMGIKELEEISAFRLRAPANLRTRW